MQGASIEHEQEQQYPLLRESGCVLASVAPRGRARVAVAAPQVMSLGEGARALRKPFLVAAVVLVALAVLVEIGGAVAVSPELDAQRRGELQEAAAAEGAADLFAGAGGEQDVPGYGIAALALVDGVLLLTVALMGAGLLVPERVHGRIQGIVTLVVSLVVLLLAIFLIFRAVVALTIMLTLLAAAPFGPLAYMAIYGFFDRGGASLVLSAVMLLKLAALVCLLLAHQDFVKMKGLVLIVVTSLVAGVVVSWLHGFVPLLLVSVSDAVAGIVVSVFAAVWAVVLLVGAIVSIVKALRVDRALSR